MIRKLWRKTHQYVRVSLLRSFVFIAGAFSWEMASKIGEWLGEFAFILSKKIRQQTLNNIETGYPEYLNRSERNKLVHHVFRNLGRCFFQSLKIAKLSSEQIRDLADGDKMEELFQRSFKKNRSVMLITAHYGNWELFGARLGAIAHTSVLAKMNPDPLIQQQIQANRAAVNVVELDRGHSGTGRKIKKISLAGNQILGVLMDQDTKVQGVFSKFLRNLANTPSGPASIALKDWFDVYMGFIHREEGGKYRIYIEGPLEIQKTGNNKNDIQIVTDRFNELIGRQIMRDPTQWVWVHRRWRRRPEELTH